MIRLVTQVKDIQAVAVSGGVDSMTALEFLRAANKSIKAVYFNHGTEHSENAENFLDLVCEVNKIPLIKGTISSQPPKGVSKEAFWRDERYKFLASTGLKIATAHHLNDVAETYLLGVIHGTPKVIPVTREPNIIRPFLLTEKAVLTEYAHRNQIVWIEDPSNKDLKYSRNRIRHSVLPEILKLNPGFVRGLARFYNDLD